MLVTMNSPTFAATMRERMERYYIAESDVARCLGVAPSLVSRWVRGEAAPSSEDLPQLGRILRLSSQQLTTVLGDTHPIQAAARPPLELIEQAAREYWQELRLLPPAFREAVLVAQLRGVATEDLPA